tara:strand:- start:9213 stop:9341 length:129 start_codon:yes stop_codon:yes gene_type:complete
MRERVSTAAKPYAEAERIRVTSIIPGPLCASDEKEGKSGGTG